MKKQINKHDYSGECSPLSYNFATFNKTFSVGCFQWLPKAQGKGLKKSPVKFRVKGLVSEASKVYAEAEMICRWLDEGWVPTKKSKTAR